MLVCVFVCVCVIVKKQRRYSAVIHQRNVLNETLFTVLGRCKWFQSALWIGFSDIDHTLSKVRISYAHLKTGVTGVGLKCSTGHKCGHFRST